MEVGRAEDGWSKNWGVQVAVVGLVLGVWFGVGGGGNSEERVGRHGGDRETFWVGWELMVARE